MGRLRSLSSIRSWEIDYVQERLTWFARYPGADFARRFPRYQSWPQIGDVGSSLRKSWESLLEDHLRFWIFVETNCSRRRRVNPGSWMRPHDCG
jgi:hypothetical protein